MHPLLLKRRTGHSAGSPFKKRDPGVFFGAAAGFSAAGSLPAV